MLDDSNALVPSINVSYLEFRFIYAVWWLFGTKAFYALWKKAKIW